MMEVGSGALHTRREYVTTTESICCHHQLRTEADGGSEVGQSGAVFLGFGS